MKNVIKIIYNFIFKTKNRGLTARAIFYAAVARFRIFFYPGSRLHRYLGELNKETGTEVPPIEQQRYIRLVSQRIARVAHRVPWESKCLVQGMVAQRLLREKGIQSTLYLGVGKDKEDNDKMIAHAWVRCGPYSVCGGTGEDYAVVAKFVM